MSSRSKVSALLILLAIFACGALFGVGGSFYYLKKKRQQWSERGPRDMYRVQAEKMLARMERSLDLSEEQKIAIKAELDVFSQSMKQLHQDMRPQFRELMSQRTKSIQSHLTPEQSEKFREMRKRHRERNGERKDQKKAEEATSSAASGN